MSTDDVRPATSSARSSAPLGRAALVGAAAASAVTLLAFFVMPLISFGPFRVTGAEVAGAPDTFGSDVAALALLWVIPIAAAGAVVAAVLSLASDTGRGRGVLVALLAGAAVLVYVIALAIVLGEASEAGASDQVFSVIGGGFWVGVLAAIVAVACGLSASRASTSGTR